MKKQDKNSLQRFPMNKTVYTTGAYIERIGYIDASGNQRFGWMVNGFEGGTFADGEELNVSDHGTFLDALTPPADDEECKTEWIIQEELHKQKKESVSPRIQIVKMLADHGITNLDFDSPIPTDEGYITNCGIDGVDYSDGTCEYYIGLEDDVIEELISAVELQIEANEKALDKMRDCNY